MNDKNSYSAQKDIEKIIKLKACPFCNGAAVIGRYQVLDEYFIECDRRNNCAVHPRTISCATLKLAFERWNNVHVDDYRLDDFIRRLIALGDALIANEAVFPSQEQAEHYTVVINMWEDF